MENLYNSSALPSPLTGLVIVLGDGRGDGGGSGAPG